HSIGQRQQTPRCRVWRRRWGGKRTWDAQQPVDDSRLYERLACEATQHVVHERRLGLYVDGEAAKQRADALRLGKGVAACAARLKMTLDGVALRFVELSRRVCCEQVVDVPCEFYH